MRKWRVAALALLLILGGWWTYHYRVSGMGAVQEQAPHEGFLAPDFSLPTISGQQVALADYRGKGVIVVFWVTWCHICQREVPMLQDVYERYHDKGLEILAVDYGESPQAVRSFVEKHGLTFPVLLDQDRRAGRLYRVSGFPTTVFVGPDGEIEKMTTGGPPSEALVEGGVRKILPR